jgi:flagellar M-ring protein FliF
VQNASENEESTERNAETNVSVRNNLPDPNADKAGITGQTKKEKSDETINYEISKVVENQVQEVGNIRKLSVAVLVNSVIAPDPANPEAMIYQDRPQAELDQLAKLVKSAIGFSEKRGDSVEVINLQFSGALNKLNESPLAWLKEDFHNILQTAILGIVAILAILLVIRPLVTKAIESSSIEEDADTMDALEGPDAMGQLTDQRGTGAMDGAGLSGLLEENESLVDVANIEGGIKSSSIKRITSIIDAHPEEAMATLRDWMAG